MLPGAIIGGDPIIGGAELETVTATEAELPTFPAASIACAVILTVPFGV